LNNLILLLNQVPEERLFALDQQTLIQMGVILLNAIILCVVLAYLLYNPVKEFLHKRRERIENDLTAAEEEMAKANDLIAEYEEKLAEVQKERIEIINEAQTTAKNSADKIIKQAKAEAEKIKEEQIQRNYEDSQRVKEEMRLQVINFSALMAEKLIHDEFDEVTQKEYVNRVTAAMEDSAWPN